AEIRVLLRQAVTRRGIQPVAIERTTVVGNQHDPFQLVNAHQEVELFPNRLLKLSGVLAPRQPGGTAGDSPAIVARDLQLLVAELVEGLAPAAIAAIDRHGSDPFGVPALGAGEYRQRQLRRQLDTTPGDAIGRNHACSRHSSFSITSFYPIRLL